MDITTQHQPWKKSSTTVEWGQLGSNFGLLQFPLWVHKKPSPKYSVKDHPARPLTLAHLDFYSCLGFWVWGSRFRCVGIMSAATVSIWVI